MTKINTIFFDWGGVIADDPGDDFLRELLGSLGLTATQVEEVNDTYTRQLMRGEISEAQFWTEVGAHYKVGVHDLISEEFKNWRGLIKNDDVLALVTQAKEQGIKTAVFTNVIEPTYNVINDAGYYDYFDEIIASCKVGHAKPEPEMYQLALARMHTTAKQSLFIDDKERNIAPARELGFQTVLATSPQQIIAEVTQYLQ